MLWMQELDRSFGITMPKCPKHNSQRPAVDQLIAALRFGKKMTARRFKSFLVLSTDVLLH